MTNSDRLAGLVAAEQEHDNRKDDCQHGDVECMETKT